MSTIASVLPARRTMAVALLLAALVAVAQPAVAQNYKPLKADPPTKADLNALKEAMKSGVLVKDQIDKVIVGYLATFTQPEQFGTIAETRMHIKFKILAANNVSPAVHDYIAQKVLDVCTPMMGVEYHPVARVEAALMIGDLNLTEPISVGNVPPVPLEKALVALLDVIESKDAAPAVVAAALVGVDRFARFAAHMTAKKALDPKVLERTTSALYKLAATDADLISPWIRRRAVRALGHLGQLGDKERVPQLLITILSNPKERTLLRCEAARAFGFLNLQEAKLTNIATAAYQMGVLAVACGKETRGTRATWGEDQLDALRQMYAYIYVGLHGPVDQRINPSIDGPPPEGTGLYLAAQKAKADPKGVAVEAIVPKLDGLYDLAMSKEPPDDRNLADAISQLEAYLQEAAAAGGVGAEKTVAN